MKNGLAPTCATSDEKKKKNQRIIPHFKKSTYLAFLEVLVSCRNEWSSPSVFMLSVRYKKYDGVIANKKIQRSSYASAQSKSEICMNTRSIWFTQTILDTRAKFLSVDKSMLWPWLIKITCPSPSDFHVLGYRGSKFAKKTDELVFLVLIRLLLFQVTNCSELLKYQKYFGWPN